MKKIDFKNPVLAWSVAGVLGVIVVIFVTAWAVHCYDVHHYRHGNDYGKRGSSQNDSLKPGHGLPGSNWEYNSQGGNQNQGQGRPNNFGQGQQPQGQQQSPSGAQVPQNVQKCFKELRKGSPGKECFKANPPSAQTQAPPPPPNSTGTTGPQGTGGY